MSDTSPFADSSRPDRRGRILRIGFVLVVVLLVAAWPLSRRLASQPQVDPAMRQQCHSWIKEYRSSLLLYWAGADTDDRVNKMLNRYAKQGPRHLDRLIVQGASGLTGADLGLIEASRRALDDYNAEPARRASEASQAAVRLIAMAQALDRLEKSLAR